MVKKKPKKPLTRAELHLKACHVLALPPSCILSVVPNCSKTKYFIQWWTVGGQGKTVFHVERFDAKDLEGRKPCR